jgi:hypothetical protein
VTALENHKANGITDVVVQSRDQLRMTAEIGVGRLDGNAILLRASSLTDERL